MENIFVEKIDIEKENEEDSEEERKKNEWWNKENNLKDNTFKYIRRELWFELIQMKKIPYKTIVASVAHPWRGFYSKFLTVKHRHKDASERMKISLKHAQTEFLFFFLAIVMVWFMY